MRRRGLLLLACAAILCFGGCSKEEKDSDAQKNDTENQDSVSQEDDYSPIIAKDIETMDEEIEYPYEIQVNRGQNCITIYGTDDTGKYVVPMRAMICSVGEDAPLGTFQLGETSRWRMEADGAFCQYATRIVDEVVFHSAPYFSQNNDDLNVEQFNQMGNQVEGNSIQLEVADAKWIANNCPEGTKVVIYDEKEAGPLGKPKERRLKEETKDPTDTGKASKKSDKYVPLVFQGTEDTTITLQQSCDLMDGVTARDNDENDLTAQIQVFGSVDNTVTGIYKIAYLCKNGEDETRIVERTIEVTQAAVQPETASTQQEDVTVFPFLSEQVTPSPSPTPTPTPVPTPVPTQVPEQVSEPVATVQPSAELGQNEVYIFAQDVTPPQIEIVASSRYTSSLNTNVLAKRVRVTDNSGSLEHLYVTVQPLSQQNYYVVIYEAIDASDNRACVSEMVRLAPGTVFKSE